MNRMADQAGPPEQEMYVQRVMLAAGARQGVQVVRGPALQVMRGGLPPTGRAGTVTRLDRDAIRDWAEEIQDRGMRSDHVEDVADAALALLGALDAAEAERDRLEEIRQRDDRFIKELQAERGRLARQVEVQPDDQLIARLWLLACCGYDQEEFMRHAAELIRAALATEGPEQ